MKCNICGNETIEIDKVYDDRYGYKGLFPLHNCIMCHHAQLDTELTADQVTELYTQFYPRSNYDVENYKPYTEAKGFRAWLNGEFRSAFRWVPENVKVLDIGCGFAETLGYHRNRGCDAYGVEADENVRKVAERYGFNIEIGMFDPCKYEKGYFDYVTLDQVIEHMQEPLKLLKDIKNILKDNGKLIISTPNVSGWGRYVYKRKWINWHAPYHINLFSAKSIKAIAQKSGFKVQMLKTMTSSEWLYYQYIHNILYPEQGEKSLFWCSRFREAKLNKKLFLGVVFILHKVKIFHIITRIVDLLNIGDSIITIMEIDDGKANNPAACL